MDSFSRFHPIIGFVFFTAVIIFSMFLLHPVFLTVSLICSFAYSVKLKGENTIRFNLLFFIPLFVLMPVINGLINHKGVTILFYLKSGNPFTLESVYFGAAAALMFASVIFWFSCFNAVMTSDKLMFLFGRVIPSASLIFSMVMRFVPRYQKQIKVISQAQRSIGLDISSGSVKERCEAGMKILSVMTTWALENAIDTADSMRARGYGLKGRTSFSIYRFDGRDKAVLILLICLIAFLCFGFFAGGGYVRYFPAYEVSLIDPFNIALYFAYAALCIMPLLINTAEEFRWKRIQ